jgi:hypothetical protein
MVRTSVLTEEQAAPAGPAESAPGAAEPQDRCPACGAELAEDQEWCLECGAARAQVHAPPDWRIGLIIVLAVIAVVAIVAAVLWP